LDDPSVIDQDKTESVVIRNDATGVGVANHVAFTWHDFGSSGHGPLTAARDFFIAVQGSTNVSAMSASARILYRLVKISTLELTGLIQELLGT